MIPASRSETVQRSAEPFSSTGICASRIRSPAPSPSRHSSRMTPRSLSISTPWNDTLCAKRVFKDGERPNPHDRPIAGRDLQLVNRLVEACVRVHVRAEPHAERLHETRDLLLGTSVRAVERHVLDEMRQPAAVFVFEHRTCLHHEPEAGPRLRRSVLANVVAQAVWQRANRDQRIDRNRLVERRIFKVDGGGRLLGAGKADATDVNARIGNSSRIRVRRVGGILPLNWRGGLCGFDARRAKKSLKSVRTRTAHVEKHDGQVAHGAITANHVFGGYRLEPGPG